MNERIQEFLKTATDNILGVPVVDQKKFAELIINECIDIANDTRYDGKVVANRIKFVFGVEQ